MINSLKKHWRKTVFRGFLFTFALWLAMAPELKGADQPASGGNVTTESTVPQKLAVVLNPGDLNFLKAPQQSYVLLFGETLLAASAKFQLLYLRE